MVQISTCLTYPNDESIPHMHFPFSVSVKKLTSLLSRSYKFSSMCRALKPDHQFSSMISLLSSSMSRSLSPLVPSLSVLSLPLSRARGGR